jgi:hypothetical protein
VGSGQGFDASGTDSGAAFVVYGPTTGTVMTTDGDIRYLGEAASDGVGIGLANVGDTNSDGKDDLMLGAWFNDHSAANGGSAYLFR